MTTTQTRVAAIPEYTGNDPNLKAIFSALKSFISTREGHLGNPDDAYMTPRRCKNLAIEFLRVISRAAGQDAQYFSSVSVGDGEITCGSINKEAGTLTFEIGGTAVITIGSAQVTLAQDMVLPADGTIKGSGGSSIKFGTSEIVVNDEGRDSDYRVESDDEENAFVVKGSSGDIGLGTSSPRSKLHLRENSANGVYIYLTNDTTGHTLFDGATFGITGADLNITNNEGGGIVLSTNGYNCAELNSDYEWVLKGGIVALKETTTPTSVSGYGRIYTKSDNKLYFQDGDGTEHEIAFV